MNSLTQITVPFHSAELYLVEHNGQPYTPMKPIVEGMGLDWAAQFNKLKQKFASTIAEIAMVANDGKERLMMCLPVRKLPAWLYSISPNKIKPELRDNVILYQNECDDVLWDYWTKGQAINKRHAISPEQQALLHEIVDRRSHGERKIYAEMWSRHNRHFKIAKYSQLLSVHFSEAIHYLETMEIKSKKSLPKSGSNQNIFDKLHSDIINKVTDYIWNMHQEIRRLKGVVPAYPTFDEDTLIQAFVSQQLQGKRMFLTFNPLNSEPQISLVEDDLLMVRRNEIEKLLNDPDKVPQNKIPEIIRSAAKRLK